MVGRYPNRQRNAFGRDGRAVAVFVDQTASTIFAAASVRDKVVEWLTEPARQRKSDPGLKRFAGGGTFSAGLARTEYELEGPDCGLMRWSPSATTAPWAQLAV